MATEQWNGIMNEKFVNAERANPYGKPAPLSDEQKAIERRWKTVFHADKIGPFNKLMGEISRVNEALQRFGVGPAFFDALSDDDFADPYLASKLTQRIGQLRSALSERRTLLAEYEEEAAAEDLARKRAAETSVERELREMREEIAKLKGGRHQEAPPHRDIQTSREAPPMPFTTPNLLSAATSYYGCTPAGARIDTTHSRHGAAVQLRRSDEVQVQASGPALTNADTLTLRPSSPADLERALRRDFVR
jgi:hypothetical protein